MAGEWIVAAIRQEIRDRIPENWDTYHSPSCGRPLCGPVHCADDCPSFYYLTTGLWCLWTRLREMRDRQDQLQRQQAEIYALHA